MTAQPDRRPRKKVPEYLYPERSLRATRPNVIHRFIDNLFKKLRIDRQGLRRKDVHRVPQTSGARRPTGKLTRHIDRHILHKDFLSDSSEHFQSPQSSTSISL